MLAKFVQWGEDRGDKLECAVVVSLKVLASFWSVNPEATLPTYRAGALNGESDNVGRV